MLQAQGRRISDLESQLQSSTRPVQTQFDQMKMVNLTGGSAAGVQALASARVFIDLQNNRWYFFGEKFKQLPSDKTYELWLINAGRKIPAGTFTVAADGSGVCDGVVPKLAADAPVVLAVTDEPSPGTQSPQGSVQVSGSLQ